MTTVRSLFGALAASLVLFSPAVQSQTAQRLIGHVDGVRLECVRYDGDTNAPLLTTINNHLTMISEIAPWRGYALRLKPDCSADVIDKMVQWERPTTIWDLRQYAEGRYVHQTGTGHFGYWHGTLWFRSANGDLQPPFFPVPPGPIDPHVSVARAKDVNFFLFYVTRMVGLDQYVIDTEIRGFLPTTQEVWRWTSRGAVPPQWSRALIGEKRFEDRLHVNSIQVLKDALVVGGRDIDTVMLISLADTSIIEAIRAPEWTFVDDPAGGFRKAHTPQLTPQGTLILFDNGWMREKPYPSRAVEYKLDFRKKTATLIWEQKAAEDYPNRNTMGSVYETPDGYRVVGWGAIDQSRMCRAQQMVPMYSIYKAGRVVREVRMPCGWSSYAVRPDIPERDPTFSLAEIMAR